MPVFICEDFLLPFCRPSTSQGDRSWHSDTAEGGLLSWPIMALRCSALHGSCDGFARMIPMMVLIPSSLSIQFPSIHVLEKPFDPSWFLGDVTGESLEMVWDPCYVIHDFAGSKSTTGREVGCDFRVPFFGRKGSFFRSAPHLASYPWIHDQAWCQCSQSSRWEWCVHWVSYGKPVHLCPLFRWSISFHTLFLPCREGCFFPCVSNS